MSNNLNLADSINFAITSGKTPTFIYNGTTYSFSPQGLIDFVAAEQAGPVLASVTATAAELNYLDIATLGTGAASKAVVLDAGDDYTWPAAGILTYGVLKDPAGTTLSATAGELNVLDNLGVAVTIGIAASATTDGMDITVTVVNAAGTTVAAAHNIELWMSEAATGIGLTADAYSGDLTASTGSVWLTHTAKKHWTIQTAATGIFVATLVDSANPVDQYVAAKNPLGADFTISAISGTNWEGAV